MGMERTLVQAYIHQRLSDQEKLEVEKLKESKPEFRLLIDLIDACREIVDPSQTRVPAISGRRAENLFIRLLSFHIRRQDAAVFLAGLSDPIFFSTIQPLLVTATTPESDETDDLNGLRVMSDAEIYQNLMANLDKKPFVRKKFGVFCAISGSAGLERLRRLLWSKPAFITGVALICLLFAFLLVRRPENPVYRTYFGAPHPVLLQGHSSGFENSLRSFQSDSSRAHEIWTGYKLAMASYMNRQYKEALTQFQNIEAEFDAAYRSERDVLFEFFFYYGMTHLNLAGSRGHQKHLDETIRCLLKCEHIIGPGFANSDDVSFFLALAHSMRGDQVALNRRLDEISQQSFYFEDAKRLRPKKDLK